MSIYSQQILNLSSILLQSIIKCPSIPSRFLIYRFYYSDREELATYSQQILNLSFLLLQSILKCPLNYNNNFLEIYSYQHCPTGMVNSQETAQARRTSHHRSLETTRTILRRCGSCYAILGQFTPRIGGSCHVGVIYCVYPLFLLLFVILFYPFLIFLLRSTSARIPFFFFYYFLIVLYFFSSRFL